MGYAIITDSSANLSDEQISEYGVGVIQLVYLCDGKEYKGSGVSGETASIEFYNLLRTKHKITTSLPAYEEYVSKFEEQAKQGNDILYIGFSSGLSGTFQAVSSYLKEMVEKYPRQKFIAVDSLCAAYGQGLLVYYAAQMQKQGKSIDEVANWLEGNKLRICHEFTVDDLFYLKRGGRISSVKAIFGSILQIKPVMHVNNEGKLVVVKTVRGRKPALKTIVDNMEAKIDKSVKQPVFIIHGDCKQDADYVAEMVKERFGFDDITIAFLDPVIGCHSGPGTVALFYYGEKR